MLPPWGTGTSKTHFFFSAEKETVFECQRKRGFMSLPEGRHKWHGGEMLYATNQHPSRPRPSVGGAGKSCGPISQPPGFWTMRAWVRDAPEWKAVRSYPAKMLCCWAQGSTSAAAHLLSLRRRRDNVSRRC